MTGVVSGEVIIVDESAGASVLQPAWSPQGNELFFVSNASNSRALLAMYQVSFDTNAYLR